MFYNTNVCDFKIFKGPWRSPKYIMLIYLSNELICTIVLCDDVSLAGKKSVTNQKN
jgi:hypothetical protein